MVKPLRVHVITVDEPVYAPVYVSKIIERTHQHVIGITAVSPTGKKSWVQFLRDRFSIYGFRDFVRAAMLFSRCRLQSFLPSTMRNGHDYSIAQVAARHNIDIYPSSDINAPGYLDLLDELDIDIVVSVAVPQLFRGRLLNIPRIACLNVHSALLPKYRGVDGLFWALLHEESEVGVTVHLMNEAFDAGDIVAQQAFDVSETDTLHMLYQRAIDVGATLIARTLDDFASSTVKYQPNDVAAGSYFSAPTPEAAKRFLRLGRRFF